MVAGVSIVCSYCKDLGYLVYDREQGDPLHNKVIHCPKCAAERRYDELKGECGLPVMMLSWTFEDTLRLSHLAKAYDAARALAEDPHDLLAYLGPVGVGKSRLLACIVNFFRLRGRKAIYTTVEEMMDDLRQALTDGKYEAKMKELMTVEVLCLDEFDAWNPTPWAQEKFRQIIDNRYRNGDQALTVLAANVLPEDLPDWLRSRMEDAKCRVFIIDGPDVRKHKRD